MQKSKYNEIYRNVHFSTVGEKKIHFINSLDQCHVTNVYEMLQHMAKHVFSNTCCCTV